MRETWVGRLHIRRSTVLKLWCNSGNGASVGGQLSFRGTSHLQGRDARRRSEPSAYNGLACRIRQASRARLWCCSVYQTGAHTSSSSNDSKNASATILNCESSDFSPPIRGRDFPSKGSGTMLLPSRSFRFSRLRGLSGGPGLTKFATLR